MNNTTIDTHTNPHEYLQPGTRVTKISLCCNFLLIIVKAIAGIWGNSYALISDAVHSGTDLLSDFGVYVGLTMASKPKDNDHRYGHGKIENYTAHIIGLFLMGVGLLIGFAAAWTLYTKQKHSIPGSIAMIGAAISIIVKEILYQITVRVGNRIKSKSLIANAWHHRSDALSSIAALIGVGCAHFVPNLHAMDEIISIFIAVVVVYIGFTTSAKAFKDIIDTSPPPDFCKDVEHRILQVDDVRGVHDLRARYYSSCIFLDVHITVDPTITVRCGHSISKKVEKVLLEQFEDIVDVTVHIDPEEH